MLVQKCRANNSKAQELFFKKFYSFAMQTAMRYSRDEHDAADILSVSFTKIFRSIHSFDFNKGSLHAWIKKVVINEALTQLKSRQKFNHAEIIDSVEEHKTGNPVMDRIDAKDLLEQLRKLSPVRQFIFNLYVVEGYNQEEISLITGIKTGTCKWHLHEARKELQQHIFNLKKA